MRHFPATSRILGRLTFSCLMYFCFMAVFRGVRSKRSKVSSRLQLEQFGHSIAGFECAAVARKFRA